MLDPAPERVEQGRPAPDVGRLAQNGQPHLDPGVGQEDELVLEGVLPIDHVLVELHAVAFLARVLELVERQVFGIEQGPVLQKEVVVDRLMHVVPPTAGPTFASRCRKRYFRHASFAWERARLRTQLPPTTPDAGPFRQARALRRHRAACGSHRRSYPSIGSAGSVSSSRSVPSRAAAAASTSWPATSAARSPRTRTRPAASASAGASSPRAMASASAYPSTIVAVPRDLAGGIEREVGPAVGHGQDDAHLVAAAARRASASPAGTPVTTWTTLNVPSAAASDPLPAAAMASDRSSAPSAASKDCTHWARGSGPW